MDFLNRASEIADKLVEYRRHQHMHPEIGRASCRERV